MALSSVFKFKGDQKTADYDSVKQKLSHTTMSGGPYTKGPVTERSPYGAKQSTRDDTPIFQTSKKG